MLNLTTDAGDLDLTFTPAGFEGGFAQLSAEAEELELATGTITRVARLRAIIRSKEVADREKDRRALPYLRALLEERGEA